MGTADIIPGVSGGTMALIVGIYQRLITALSTGFSAVIALARVDVPRTAGLLREVEWRFVVPLLAGIGFALVAGARIIPGLLEAYPQECLGLFFGLVGASIGIPWKRIDRKDLLVFSVAGTSAVVSFVLTGIPPRAASVPSLLQIFAAASVAICAMILPGVSGAFLLKVMGIYEATLEAVNTVDLAYVATFMLGAVVGLGLFSKLLSYLLDHWSDVTMAALVGLMAGALRAIWPWQAPDRSLLWPSSGDPILSVILLALAGFGLVTLLIYWGDRMERTRSTLEARDSSSEEK